MKYFVDPLSLLQKMLSIGLVAASVCFLSPVVAQDSATYDSIQGAWRFYYQNPETEQWVNKTYFARHQIEPRVRSEVNWRNGGFQYDYRIQNDRAAKLRISPIELWSLPLVIEPSTLPALTATHEQSELRQLQNYARFDARRAFEKSIVRSPTGWNGSLRVDKEAAKTSIVWNVGLRDTDSVGIRPGESISGFGLSRPELPGVARMQLQGRVPEPWILDSLPETDFWKAKVKEIEDQDYVLAAVIAPVIEVPSPYSGAELARRIKAHANTWVKYGHISQPLLDKLNLKLDQLIVALGNGNKKLMREIYIDIATSIFREHAGMNLGHCLEDEEKHNSKKQMRVATAGSLSEPNIDRLAARVLVYDLFYLLVRMEMGH
jgi:hypothetical protein